MLLSAGLGTRLRPLTEKVPKCLMLIKGKPLLEIWLDRLSEAGITEFLVNTHHLHEQVQDFVAASSYKKQITLAHEPKLLGTAGTLLANLNFFQGMDGLLIHADNYCLADLKEFQDVHKKSPKNCVMTMMTFRTDEPSTCGIAEIDKNRIVINFHEKISNPPGNLANAAVYILSEKLIERMKLNFNHVKDFSTEVLPKLKGEIYSYETTKLHIDIGTLKAYEMANKA